MHSRCCWPPDSAAAGLRRDASRTSFHRPARVRHSSTRASVGLCAGRPVEPQPGQHVVGDRHRRERVRLLEHHADRRRASVSRWSGRRCRPGRQEHRAGQAGAGNQLVHPVEDPQERRLAAAGRPDQGGHRPAGMSRRPGRAPVGAEPRAHVDGVQPRGRQVGRGGDRIKVGDLVGLEWFGLCPGRASSYGTLLQALHGQDRGLLSQPERTGGAGGRRVNAERGGGERRRSGGAGGGAGAA